MRLLESNHSFTQRKENNYYKLIQTVHLLVKSTIMMLIWNLAATVNVLDSLGIHKVTIRSIWDLTPPQDGMQQSGTLHI